MENTSDSLMPRPLLLCLKSEKIVCYSVPDNISKKPYSILNQMLLKHSGEYATFKQWQDLGGHVKKVRNPK